MLKLRYLLSLTLFITSFFYLSPIKASAQEYVYTDVAPASSEVVFRTTLAKSIPYIGANFAHSSGFSGSGQHIVIIDTGIESSHPFFGGRVVLEACFASRCPNGSKSQIGPGAARPVHFHGTHVAGIAAGSSSTMKGVAPAASIIAINVFDETGAAYDSDITAALNWVDSISSQYNIASVNMSLGSTRVFKTTCDGYVPEMTNAIRSLRDKKIATVIAAGNSFAVGMSSPACISFSVSVAALNQDSDEVTTFSNINNLTTIAAPGSSIMSSALMGSYRSASGTSMAAPHVAGAFAVYNSKYGKQSVDKVISDFKINAPIATDTYSGIKVFRLSFTNLFSSISPSPTTTLPGSTTTTTSIPSTTSTTTSSTSTTSTTTSTIPSTTSTLPLPINTNISRPIMLDMYGGFTTAVLIKYKTPAVGRNFVSHYNLYCVGKNGSSTYTIPHQTRWRIDRYFLSVSPTLIDTCYMTAVSLSGRESLPSNTVAIWPSNRK